MNVYIDLACATAGSRDKALSLALSPQPHSLYSRGCDSANKPAALDSAALVVLLRSLPSFPWYSTAGAVDGGGGASWDGSGADCRTGGARAGVSLSGVLSIRVFVLLRPRGVEGRCGKSGTRSTSFSGVAALTLPLLVIF